MTAVTAVSEDRPKNSPFFPLYRGQQLQILWSFLYDPDIRNLFAGTTRRFGKTYSVVEVIFLVMLDTLGVIWLGSEKLDALKTRNGKLAREYNLILTMPLYRQITDVYRKSAIPAAADRYRRMYPQVQISTPLSGELVKMTYKDRSIFCQAGGLEARSAEFHRGSGAEILIIDEVASADYSVVEQIYNPTLRDSRGLTLVVGSAQAASRKTNKKTQIAGFSKVRKHYQSTPRHSFIKISIDDAVNDDGSPLLDKQEILEEMGWDEEHPIFLQEYMVDDEIIPDQGLFRLWNKWRDAPHRLHLPEYAVSADLGYRDQYAVFLYAFEKDPGGKAKPDGTLTLPTTRVNVVWYKEYTETITEDILKDLYPVIRERTQRLKWLYLPADSNAHYTNAPETTSKVWMDWPLSPPKHKVYTQLKNTEPEIRRCLNVINRVRIDMPAGEQRELLEERIKNATFSLGEKELIYHDQHSHAAHALMYGILGMLKSGVLVDPDLKPKGPKRTPGQQHVADILAGKA